MSLPANATSPVAITKALVPISIPANATSPIAIIFVDVNGNTIPSAKITAVL